MARDVGSERIPVTGERDGADFQDGLCVYQLKVRKAIPKWLWVWLGGIVATRHAQRQGGCPGVETAEAARHRGVSNSALAGLGGSAWPSWPAGRGDRMTVVYIAGPFRGKSSWDVEQNIRRAETLALEVWRLGAVALCPHTNTRFFDGAADDRIWLDGDMELLKRCDAVLLTADWARSTGASAEKEHAHAIGVPVLFSIEELRAHMRQEHEMKG